MEILRPSISRFRGFHRFARCRLIIIDLLLAHLRSSGADVLHMHLVDFRPAPQEAERVCEEHAVRREHFAVRGVVQEVFEPDANDQGAENALFRS